MGKFLNNLVKFLGFIFVFFVTVLNSYLIGILLGSVILSLVSAVWSAIHPLPFVLTNYYYLVLLTGSIPIGIVVFIFVVRRIFKK